jgi:hypothetical protein
LNGPKEGKEENRRPLLDYGPLFGNVRTDHSADDEAAAPLGWLSVVGETRLWPLGQFDPRNVNDKTKSYQPLLPFGSFDSGDIKRQIRPYKPLGPHHYVNPPDFLATGLASGVALLLVVCFAFWNRGRRCDENEKENSEKENSERENSERESKSSVGSRLLAGMRWLRLEAGRSAEDKSIDVQKLFSFDRSIYTSIFFISVSAILICFGAPTLAYLFEFEPRRSVDGWARTIVCLGVLLSAIAATSVAALSAAISAYGYEFAQLFIPKDENRSRVAKRQRLVDSVVPGAVLSFSTLAIFGVVFSVLNTAVASLGNLFNYFPSVTSAIALFVVRCSNYSDLVNPLLPIAFLSAMVAIWAYCSLKRLLLVTTYDFCNPLEQSALVDVEKRSDWYYAAQLKRLEQGYRYVLDAIEGYVSLGMRFPDWFVGVGLMMFVAHLLWRDWVPTCEGAIYDSTFRLMYFCAIVMTIGLMLRVRNLFRSTDLLLRWVDHLPLAKRFAEIPIEVRSKASDVLYATHPKIDDYSLMIHQIEKLARKPPEGVSMDHEAVQKLVEHGRDGMKTAVDQQRRPEEDAHLGREMSNFISRQLTPYLLDQWSQTGAKEGEKKDDKENHSYLVVRLIGAKLAKRQDDQVTVQDETKETDPAAAWLRDAETLIAVQIAHQIRVVFLYARTLLGGVIAMYLCLLWATNSYPFQPGQMMNFTCLMLMLWMVIIVFNAILRFNRNPILSKINGTEPNRLTFDSSFWVPMISYIGLPILAVLATLLPTVGRSLFSWTAIFSQMLGSGG